MRLAERLQSPSPLRLDGGMGTALIERGLEPQAERAPTWSIVHPREVLEVHEGHVRAGAELILTNTFSEIAPTQEEAAASLALARAARPAFVAASLWGDLPASSVEEAAPRFSTADAIWLETTTRPSRALAAVRALRRATDVSVIVTFAFTVLAGEGWEAELARLAEAGALAVGFNCSPWPRSPGALAALVRRLAQATAAPIVLKPDASGMSAKAWATEVARAARVGALLVGGCCGATDAHLAQLSARLEGTLSGGT